MSLLQALLLGAVQGLTEFLPISSDGHLTLIPFFFGWDSPSLAFIVATHVGTLAAAVWVFKDEIARVVRTVLKWKDASEQDRFLVRLLAVGTVPAVIAGVAFDGLVEQAVDKPVLAAFLLGVTGWWLLSSETHFAAQKAHQRIDVKDSVAIGIAQATAILPGISRSGMTIGMAMRRGTDRETATRFSFLLGIPIIAGAIVFKVPDMLSEGVDGGAAAFVVAIIASAATGLLAIRGLLALVRTRTLRPFGAYCLVVTAIGLIVALAKG